MEVIEGKTHRELTLLQHLLNFRKIYPNTSEQTRTMAVFMYCILYEQITGLQKSQTGCAAKFRCQKTPFKRLITGKRQSGRPCRSGDVGKSGRKLEDIAVMEGSTLVKVQKVTPKPTCWRGKGRGRGKKGKWGWVKILKIISRIGKTVVRIVSQIRRLRKNLKQDRKDWIFKRADVSTVHIVYTFHFISEIFTVILS